MYTVAYSELVTKKDIPKISSLAKKQIKKTIEERLVKKPLELSIPLRYSLKGYRRFRVRDYRVIYAVKEKEIIIIGIGRREDLYSQ